MDEASLAPDLESPAGLGLLDFYPLPHFGEEPFTQDVEKTIVRYGQRYDLRTLNNHQAILIDDNSQALKGDY
ncbi:Type 1 glutamine amidotransferase-like domain-containing protein [Leuconostoc citreum]